MALKGDLASVDLAQVFQMLALNKKVGLLSIQSPRLWKILYFDQRGVTLYYNPYNLLDRAIAAFVRAGRIMPAVVEDLRDHASRNQLGFLDALLAGGYLGEEEVGAQMRYELEEEIYDLFFCKDARFEFFEGVDKLPEREGVVDGRFFFNTESVIMEAARRIDEWSYIAERITNGLEVFCPSDVTFDPAAVDDESGLLYDFVDGCHNVARIVEASGLSSFTVFKQLCQLLDQGFIVAQPTDRLVEMGRRCLADGRTQDAINLFEKAIEQKVGIPEVHSKAAEAYQANEEYENAIYHLQCEGEYRDAAGDHRGAAQRLLAAVQLVPTNLAARGRLVEIALTHDVKLPEYDAVAEGKVLVDLLMAAGDLAQVRGLLERLLKVRPTDLDLKKILVNVHTKAGDHARVVDLYLSIADTLQRENKPLEAVGYLQKVLMLDRSRADVSEKVRSLYTIDERRRTRRRAVATLGALCMLLVAVGIAYQYYDRVAAADFERIDVKAQLEANEFAVAATEYQRFLAEHPLSTVNLRASEELARIEALRLKFEAALENQRAARDRDRQQIRSEYRAEWRRHRELFHQNPEQSLLCIERVRKLVTEAGQQEDLAWALEEKVEKTWTNMRGFLERATELARRSEEELAAGRIENARALALDLVNNYDITAPGRAARVPVQIGSRPRGARLLRAGAPVTRTVDGVEQPVLTPTLVMCGKDAQAFELQLDGFEPATFNVDVRKATVVEISLKVIPERSIHFASPAQGPLANGSGCLIAGLRNGQLGVASARTGQVRHVFSLGGLRAMDGTPAIVGDRAYFSSNESTLECVLLDKGDSAPGWPVKLPSQPQTDLMVRDGRLLFVDRDFVLRCYDQASGQQLWSQQLDGSAAGVPTLERRQVRVATGDGRLSVFDATSGAVVKVWRAPSGITTRVWSAAGHTWFGGADGKVRSFDETTETLVWAVDLGHVVTDGETMLVDKGLVVLGADNRLRLLARGDGSELASYALKSPFLGSMQYGAGRLLVVARKKEPGKPPRDTLHVLDPELSLMWEHAEAGVFGGAPALDGEFVVLAGASGDVVVFR